MWYHVCMYGLAGLCDWGAYWHSCGTQPGVETPVSQSLGTGLMMQGRGLPTTIQTWATMLPCRVRQTRPIGPVYWPYSQLRLPALTAVRVARPLSQGSQFPVHWSSNWVESTLPSPYLAWQMLISFRVECPYRFEPTSHGLHVTYVFPLLDIPHIHPTYPSGTQVPPATTCIQWFATKMIHNISTGIVTPLTPNACLLRDHTML